VPHVYQADPALRRWVSVQRRALKKGTLKPDLVARLDRIGFQVDPLIEKWNEKFSKLEAYHASNGHCNVPRYHAGSLGRWVRYQREALKKGTLKPDRVARLNGIGFQADPQTVVLAPPPAGAVTGLLVRTASGVHRIQRRLKNGTLIAPSSRRVMESMATATCHKGTKPTGLTAGAQKGHTQARSGFLSVQYEVSSQSTH
jgi:hypothetical protein